MGLVGRARIINKAYNTSFTGAAVHAEAFILMPHHLNHSSSGQWLIFIHSDLLAKSKQLFLASKPF